MDNSTEDSHQTYLIKPIKLFQNTSLEISSSLMIRCYSLNIDNVKVVQKWFYTLTITI